MSYYFISTESDFLWEMLEFECYWWKYQNSEILLNFQNFQLKWKILKHFTRPKQRAAFRKLFSPPPDKIYIRRCTGIYRHLLFQCFANAVSRFLEMMKCKFFSNTNQKNVCLKIFKASRFCLCCGSIFFTLLSKLRFVK